MWNLDQVNIPEVWSSGYTGSDVVVLLLILVLMDHPEFSGRIVPGYDFVDGDSVPEDGNSHGNSCCRYYCGCQ